jgi:hypothetical protein
MYALAAAKHTFALSSAVTVHRKPRLRNVVDPITLSVVFAVGYGVFEGTREYDWLNGRLDRLFWHLAANALIRCPLLEVKRTLVERVAISAYDP